MGWITAVGSLARMLVSSSNLHINEYLTHIRDPFGHPMHWLTVTPFCLEAQLSFCVLLVLS